MGNSANRFRTIQHAIGVAASGTDSINVASGTYTENINFSGKSLKLVGASASNTIIDGNNSAYVVVMNTNESSTTLL